MNTLINLEKLVNTYTQNTSTTENLIPTLATEKEKVISAFKTTICQPGNNLEQYIRFQQHQLLELMDTISTAIPYEAFANPPEENNLLRLYHVLLDLLTYLEKSCPQHLDFRCKVPLIYLITARQVISRELSSLRQLLVSTGISDLLLEIVLAPIEELEQTINISYQRLYYIKAFSQKLQELPADSTPSHVEDVLSYMNYNNKIYLTYKTKQLKESIQEHTTTHEQLMQTKWLLKKNNQQLEHPHFQYTHLHPSLKEQIRSWLTEESIYLEHKLLYPDTTPIPSEMAKWANFKVVFDMAVPDIGCLLRMMLECGLIMNENRKEVAEFAAQFFATTNQKHISSGSLRHKMYSFPESAAGAVRDVLMEMYNKSKTISSGS